MDSSSSDLTLDYKPNGDCGGGGAYPKPAAAAAVFGVDHHHLTTTGQATQKLQEFLSRLEEERLKIEAFKRELPLCLQLLNHAMEAYRQQLEAYQMGSQQAGAMARPLVLEEFIPIKNIGIDVAASAADKAPGTSEKASWMVSAQLWNAPAADTAPAKGPQTPKENSEHHPLDTSPKLSALDGGGGGACQRNGGAFLPFSKDNAMADGSAAAALPELALAPAEKDAITVAATEVDKKLYVHDNGSNNGVVARREAQNGGKPSSTAPDGQAVPPAPQTHRKARRCWSPELHRRFVNALQILGGAQVATPKQIRELMKVDGLTNDEVKSHLQKYRLHTRRPAAPAAPTAPTPQLVVLGGIWVPPEYATQAAGPAIYGAHPATQPHYTAAVAAQEYYHHHHQSPAAAVHHLQHHPAAAALVHHRAVAPPPPPPPQLAPAYSKSAAARVGSLTDSEGRGSGGGGRDRSESIEEEGEGEERDDDDDDEIAAATNSAGADADDEEINTTTTTSAGAITY